MKRVLISIDDMNLKKIREYLSLAQKVEKLPDNEKKSFLSGKILATLFFEPSTRTRLSFESAMLRLGGSVIGFSETAATSVSKGETLQDTIYTVENYSDIIVIRHPREGAARVAAEISRVPIVNAGDGANQHPSQTLLDLYTIQKFFGSFDGLKIALVGDLKYSRTVHSLVQALVKFEKVDFLLVSPESLRLPGHVKEQISERKHSCLETSDLAEAMSICDVVYMTRIQKERFPDALEYEKVKDCFCINLERPRHARKGMKILHPLPRVNEILPEVDSTPFAGYFEQVRNGLIMRQAILSNLLGAF